MPPKRRKNFDILDKVLDTASLPHSLDIASLKQQIEEQLRVLAVRAPVKQLGKGDSEESRKLVLLEQILRASNHDAILETKKLAAAVGMKAAAFEALRFKVSQYNNVSNSSKGKRKRRSSASSQSVTSVLSRDSINDSTISVSHKSTIPALSIRLGSQVHDSHGYARHAQQLLIDVEEYIKTASNISTQQKRGYLQDMQRSRAAYEAACFYVVARGQKTKKSIRSSDSASQEEEDLQISIQDVIDASTSVSASEFRDILPTVEKFVSDIDGQKKPRAERKRPASVSAKRRRSTSRKTPKDDGNPREVDGGALALLEGVEEVAAADGTRRQNVSTTTKMTPTFIYSPKFVEWKNRVLQQERDRMKLNNASVSDGDAILLAADEVLRRNGILN